MNTLHLLAPATLVACMLSAVACSKSSEEPLSEATTTSSSVKTVSSCSTIRDRGTCSEYTSTSKTFSIERSMCGSAHGDFALTSCPLGGRIGVCELANGPEGGEVKRYYAASFNDETAKADCEQKGGQNARFLATR